MAEEKPLYALMRQEKVIGSKTFAKKGDKVLIIRDAEDVCIVEHASTKERFSVTKNNIQVL